MIFIVGAILALVGVVQFIMFLVKSKRPRIDANVLELTEEYYEKDTNQIKKFPHALVQYYYKSVSYKGKILLGRSKVQLGEVVQVCIKENEPEKPYYYSPKQEMIIALVLVVLGTGIMIGCVAILDTFNAW